MHVFAHAHARARACDVQACGGRFRAASESASRVLQDIAMLQDVSDEDFSFLTANLRQCQRSAEHDPLSAWLANSLVHARVGVCAGVMRAYLLLAY